MRGLLYSAKNFADDLPRGARAHTAVTYRYSLFKTMAILCFHDLVFFCEPTLGDSFTVVSDKSEGERRGTQFLYLCGHSKKASPRQPILENKQRNCQNHDETIQISPRFFFL